LFVLPTFIFSAYNSLGIDTMMSINENTTCRGSKPMAKKSAKKDDSATPTKAATKAPKKAKAAAADKAAAPAAPKKAAVKVKVKKAAAPKAAKAAKAEKAPKAAKAPKDAKPKAAPIKLTDSQKDLLKKVQGAAEAGYEAAKEMENRTLNALVERKLIKKGPKNKATGKIGYTLSAAGKKHIEADGAAS
jgi:predicted lipid-binding transport protein (Tim44 family)